MNDKEREQAWKDFREYVDLMEPGTTILITRKPDRGYVVLNVYVDGKQKINELTVGMSFPEAWRSER